MIRYEARKKRATPDLIRSPMGVSYREFLKAQKKGPVAPTSEARGRRDREAANQRSQAFKRQSRRTQVFSKQAKQGRLLDAW